MTVSVQYLADSDATHHFHRENHDGRVAVAAFGIAVFMTFYLIGRFP